VLKRLWIALLDVWPPLAGVVQELKFGALVVLLAATVVLGRSREVA